jgi:hypothetical protein
VFDHDANDDDRWWWYAWVVVIRFRVRRRLLRRLFSRDVSTLCAR